MKVVNTFINIFFLAGATLLLLFIVLSGSSNHSPLNKFYWIKADTSGILGAYTESEWTFWGVCESGNYDNCTNGPAFPISPKDNFHTTEGVPDKFLTDRDTFYFLTRFSFSFTIIALCFTAMALIVDLLGFWWAIIDKVMIFFLCFSVFFIFGVASFQTAAVVLAKNGFHDSDLSAKIGVKLMAILWTAVVCILIVFFNNCYSNLASSYRKHMDRVNASKAGEDGYGDGEVGAIGAGAGAGGVVGGAEGDESSFTRAAPADADADTKEVNNGGIRFFKIKRNNQKVSDEESI